MRRQASGKLNPCLFDNWEVAPLLSLVAGTAWERIEAMWLEHKGRGGGERREALSLEHGRGDNESSDERLWEDRGVMVTPRVNVCV